MPLASYYSLHWYGPGAMAATGEAVASSPLATIKGNGRLAAVGTAVASSPLARPTMGKAMGAVNTATATSPLAQIKGRARLGAVGRVNAITQDDVTGAVLEAPIEGGLTLRQVLRLLAAVAAGKTDITDLGGGSATVVFRDLADTKARITASMTGSERTSVTRDVT